ncbi:amidase [Ramlibacter sp. WS9]|uniref:amidase n=1 Tax=Ramlibacter sp. WS9 TaxID=1882741 RepID=UPI001141DCC2|nr:amidase [Ramlibacter sp. WS9]ROZ71227.1 amidase [Ramlibacter sp. WS9]
MTELWRLGATALAEGYRSGAFDPVEVLNACLTRAAACQSAVNAFVHLDAERGRIAALASRERWARGAPLGPLDGVPISLKDNLHAAGMPTTWGSRLLRDFIAGSDELPVSRLRAAGAVIFGKTNLPEFALQGITDNLLHGPTRNPWDLSLTPGGSSGGAAAAVACGCGPLALVTDGGGSTRRPASHTGLVGFKPSAGLIARGGGLPEIFLEYEVPGMLGRHVSDVQSLAGVLAERALAHASARPARILYVPRFGSNPVEPGIAQRVAEAARQLASLGHAIEEAPPAEWAEEINEVWPVLSSAGLAWMLRDAARFPELRLPAGQAADLSLCGPSAQANAAQGGTANATALFAAFAAIHVLRKRMDEVFSHCDFILTPATAALPWPAQQSHPSEIGGTAVGPRGHAVFTAFANAAGLPAIALPCGFANVLPTGFQLVARPGADAALLALALQYEQAFPWHAHWPPGAVATMAVS